MMHTTLGRVAGAVMAAALALGSGCSTDRITAPERSTRLAVTTRVDGKPAFLIQNLDGRDTQRLRFQNVADPIPGNDAGPTLTESALLNVAEPRWSPFGTRVAVTASAAFDQSELVVFDVATGHAEVASPNTQIIAGAVDWSPTGGAIAYTMSTLPSFGGIDLFVTDLATHGVKRLTTGAGLGPSALRWDLAGNAVFFSQHTGDAHDAGLNGIDQIARVDVATTVVDTIRTGIVGDVQAISREGRWAIVRRKRVQGVDTFLADLVRVDLTTGTESPIVSNESVLYAQFASNESRVLVAVGIGPESLMLAFDLVDLSTGLRARIPGLTGNVNVDLSPYPLTVRD